MGSHEPNEPRRWVLYERPEMAGTALPVEAYEGRKHPLDNEGIEVVETAPTEARIRDLKSALARLLREADQMADALVNEFGGERDPDSVMDAARLTLEQ